MRAAVTGVVPKTDSLDHPPECLLGCRVHFCFICKKDDAHDRVFSLITSPKWIDWKSDWAQEACELLQTAISTKCDKLKKVAGKKILLLRDLFRYMNPEIYRKCIDQLRGLEDFYSVFAIDSGGSAIAIYSEESLWTK